MWKRAGKVLTGVLVGAVWLLALPVIVEEGVAAWQRWITVAYNVLHQWFGWYALIIPITATIAWWSYYYPPKRALSGLRRAFLSVSALKGTWTRLCRPRLRHFDVPIRDAILHAADSTDHSYGDSVLRDKHFFNLLHESMCSGDMLVAGRKDEKGALKRIDREECKNLMPLEMVVPQNPSTPEGARYCLFERTAYEAREPLVEGEFRGYYTGLRVRSRDLYRLWPKGISVGQS